MKPADQEDSKLLNRVRSLVERSERVSVGDCGLLWSVRDLNALARIARIPRERRFGRSAFYRAGDVVLLRSGWAGTPAEFRNAREERGETPAICIPDHGPWTAEDLAGAVGASVPAGVRAPLLLDFVQLRSIAERSHVSIVDLLRTLEGRASVSLLMAAPGPTLSAQRSAGTESEGHRAVLEAAAKLRVPIVAVVAYKSDSSPESFCVQLDRIRQLQEEFGVIDAAVPLALADHAATQPHLVTPTAARTLRATATARIMLDNVDHIGAAPSLVSAEVATVALDFGADLIDPCILPEDSAESRMTAASHELVVLDSAPVVGWHPEPVDVTIARLEEAHWAPLPLPLVSRTIAQGGARAPELVASTARSPEARTP